ncbi:TPA: hypothetical protein DEG21_02905 [Patescibacteria group bacterium]|nr:hypothetical protein [Candidatus Gracilibacteria bacterium]HBY74820.1 hypothetical protein [Candidatus Gracilibacteria bacterium]
MNPANQVQLVLSPSARVRVAGVVGGVTSTAGVILIDPDTTFALSQSRSTTFAIVIVVFAATGTAQANQLTLKFRVQSALSVILSTVTNHPLAVNEAAQTEPNQSIEDTTIVPELATHD